jgi:hypothetical protein
MAALAKAWHSTHVCENPDIHHFHGGKIVIEGGVIAVFGAEWWVLESPRVQPAHEGTENLKDSLQDKFAIAALLKFTVGV